MTIRDASAVCLALLLATGCDDDGGGPPVGEPAAEAPAPGDTAPLSREDIAPPEPEAGGEPEAEPEEEPAPPAGEPGTVAARTLGARIHTVQIGAFARGANADELLGRVEASGFPVWHPETRMGGRAYERVRVGAVTSYADARRLAELLRDRYGVPTWIVPVPPETPLPSGIVDATRRALSGT